MDPKQRARYQKIVDGVGQIPSLPSVVSKLLKVINHPNSSAEDAARFIEKDIGLAGKVLKLANSPYYGIPNTIESVHSAVVLLGFNTIKSIVLSTSVVKMFPARSGAPLFNRVSFWKHCVEVALISRFLSLRTPAREVDAEIAFSAGLLHDLGTIVLDQTLAAEYQEVLALAQREGIALQNAERKLLGVDHAEISGMLMEKWDIPDALRIPATFHHRPQDAPSHVNTGWLICLANNLSHQRGAIYYPKQICSDPVERAHQVLGFKENLQELLTVADGELERAADFFAMIGS